MFFRAGQIDECVRIYRSGMILRMISQYNRSGFSRQYLSGRQFRCRTSAGGPYLGDGNGFLTYVPARKAAGLRSIILGQRSDVQRAFVETQYKFRLLHQWRVYQRVGFLLPRDTGKYQ